MKNKVVLTVLISLVLVAVIGFVGYKLLSGDVNTKIDTEGDIEYFESIKVQTYQEEDVVLEFEKPAKPIFLNFFATWCSNCVEEMPMIEEAYRQYGDKVDFIIIDLLDGNTETVAKVKDYMNKNSLTFPVYFDKYYEGMYKFRAESIPLTICIGTDGREVFRKLGTLSETEMHFIMETLTK